MTSKDIDDSFANTEISELNVMIEKLGYENRILKESFQNVVGRIALCEKELIDYKRMLLKFRMIYDTMPV